MDEAAKDRLLQNLQGRLRKLIFRVLSSMDLADVRLLPALHHLRELLASFELQVGSVATAACAGKQWQRLKAILEEESPFGGEAAGATLDAASTRWRCGAEAAGAAVDASLARGHTDSISASQPDRGAGQALVARAAGTETHRLGRCGSGLGGWATCSRRFWPRGKRRQAQIMEQSSRNELQLHEWSGVQRSSRGACRRFEGSESFQEVPTWSAEASLRQVRGMRAWAGKVSLRPLLRVSPWQAQAELREMCGVPSRQGQVELQGLQCLSAWQA